MAEEVQNYPEPPRRETVIEKRVRLINENLANTEEAARIGQRDRRLREFYTDLTNKHPKSSLYSYPSCFKHSHFSFHLERTRRYEFWSILIFHWSKLGFSYDGW